MDTLQFAGEDTGNNLPEWCILIVDDDADVHRVTKYALQTALIEGRKIKFYHAYSGIEALEILARNCIHLLLLDAIMETDDAGLLTAHRIKKLMTTMTPVIIMRSSHLGIDNKPYCKYVDEFIGYSQKTGYL